MKTVYFKNKESYFNFINEHRNEKIKKLIVKMINNKIKVVYEFI